MKMDLKLEEAYRAVFDAGFEGREAPVAPEGYEAAWEAAYAAGRAAAAARKAREMPVPNGKGQWVSVLTPTGVVHWRT
jgi:hypothetical protein